MDPWVVVWPLLRFVSGGSRWTSWDDGISSGEFMYLPRSGVQLTSASSAEEVTKVTLNLLVPL